MAEEPPFQRQNTERQTKTKTTTGLRLATSVHMMRFIAEPSVRENPSLQSAVWVNSSQPCQSCLCWFYSTQYMTALNVSKISTFIPDTHAVLPETSWRADEVLELPAITQCRYCTQRGKYRRRGSLGYPSSLENDRGLGAVLWMNCLHVLREQPSPKHDGMRAPARQEHASHNCLNRSEQKSEHIYQGFMEYQNAPHRSERSTSQNPSIDPPVIFACIQVSKLGTLIPALPPRAAAATIKDPFISPIFSDSLAFVSSWSVDHKKHADGYGRCSLHGITSKTFSFLGANRARSQRIIPRQQHPPSTSPRTEQALPRILPAEVD
ncbi:hypothetical protein V8F20_004865 [Naviculisporaceae sp. PSN 640]